MKIYWQRFVAALTPGVRVVLIAWLVVALSEITGQVTHSFSLAHWLAVTIPEFWRGQIWRVVTYWLLPENLPNFITNLIAFIIVGPILEGRWHRTELWRYCVITAAGAGLFAVMLNFSMAGAAPVTFGLLIAWGHLCGHESMLFPIFGNVVVWHMVIVLATASLAIVFLNAGLVAAIIVASGGLTGWLYLRLHDKWVLSRSSHQVGSERISRLEL